MGRLAEMTRSDPNRTYNHLLECLDRAVQVHQEDWLVQELDRSGRSLTAAPASERTSSAQNKTRGTSRGRSRGREPAAPATQRSESRGRKSSGERGGRGGKGERTPSDHAKRPCYYFHKETCKHGQACRFSHSDISASEKDKLQKPRQRSASQSTSDTSGAKQRGKSRQGRKRPCYLFKKGECKLGAKCRFSHDTTSPKEKTKDNDKVAVAREIASAAVLSTVESKVRSVHWDKSCLEPKSQGRPVSQKRRRARLRERNFSSA